MRAKSLSPAARSAIARQAALQRWKKTRFGGADFEALGLPGGHTIDLGLAGLAAGKETVESLLVSVAAPRLRREGVPLPATVFADSNTQLFRLLEKKNGNLAHARYLAYLRQAASFADACRIFRKDRNRRAK